MLDHLKAVYMLFPSSYLRYRLSGTMICMNLLCTEMPFIEISTSFMEPRLLRQLPV